MGLHGLLQGYLYLLHFTYSSPRIRLFSEIGNVEMNGGCNKHRGTKNEYNIVVWKKKVKTSSGRLRRRWKDNNIKIDNVATESPVTIVKKLVYLYNKVL
jgi:hypothetical protein